MACSQGHPSHLPEDDKPPTPRKIRHSFEYDWPLQPCRRCGGPLHATRLCSSQKPIISRAEYFKILYERELEKLMTPVSEALERRALYQVLLDGNDEVIERAHRVVVIFSQGGESTGETAEELEDLFYSWFEFGDDLMERMMAHRGWIREDLGDIHELRLAIIEMNKATELLEAFIPWAVDKSKPMPHPHIHHRYHEAMEVLDDLLVRLEPKTSLLTCVLSTIEVPDRLTEEDIATCKAKIAKQESLIAQEAYQGADECRVQVCFSKPDNSRI